MGLFEILKKKVKESHEANPTRNSQMEESANETNERAEAPSKKKRQGGIGAYLMQKHQELVAKTEAHRNYVLDYKPSADYSESTKDFSELSEVLRDLIHDYVYKGEQNRRYLYEGYLDGDYYDELDRLDKLKIGCDVPNKDEIRLLYKAREEKVFYLVDGIVVQRKLRERIDKESISILTWKDTSGMPNAIQLPSDIKVIHDGIFNECKSLNEVDLSGCKHLTRVGTDAFQGCKSLSTLKLAQSITTIGERSFYDCALEELDLSCCCNLQTIGERAFGRNESLSTLKLVQSITTIGEASFVDCALEELDLSCCCNLQTIGEYAFGGNPLWKVDFSVCPQLTEICKGVLSNCGKLEYVTLPKTLSEFHSLGNCKALRNVDMTKCTNLRVLSEPILWRRWIERNGCSYLEAADEECKWRYEGRHSMLKVVVPSGVTHIEPAFFEHIHVLDLYLPPTLKECEISTECNTEVLFKNGDSLFEKKKHYGNIHCYSTDCVDSLLGLSYACDWLHIMPELYERKEELFTGDHVKMWIRSSIYEIKERELDFYDKLYSK